jgi:putative FmdB family regulatory protein
MPLYEYRCEACGHQFEKIQRFSDDPISVCPSCAGGPVVKLLSSPAIQFKGSGWYITDYARKGKGGETATPASTSSGSGKGEASSQGDSKGSDSKARESKNDSSSTTSSSSSSDSSSASKKD